MLTRLAVAALLGFGLLCAGAACGDDDGAEGDGTGTLTVITHDSFNLSEDLIKQFEQQNNATVKLLPRGDAGAMLTSVILTKDNPEGDMVFGVDNTFLARALDEGLFASYESPELSSVPDDLRKDTQGKVTPIDYGYVNFNYDIDALRQANLQTPTKLEDLTDPKWKGKVVVEDPASSSPGLAFLIATVDYFGEDKYLEWWKQMRSNDLKVVEGWETAYNTNFTLYGGQQPVVLSYATSPPFEQMFAEPPRPDAPSGNITPPKGSFRQIEYAGVLEKSKNRALAKKFIDFLLSKAVQEDIPGQMAVFPARKDAAVPEAFTKFGTVSNPPADVSAEEIAKNRDKWIEDWTNAVLR